MIAIHFAMFRQRLDQCLRRADTVSTGAGLYVRYPARSAVRPTVASRPIEASKAMVCYVRNTSTPAVRRVGPDFTRPVLPGGIIPLWGAQSSRNRGAASFRYEGRHHPGIGGGFARNQQPATSFGSRSTSTSSGCIRVSRSAIATVEDLLAARGLDISCETVRR